MDLRAQLAVLRSRWQLILLVVVLAGVGALAASLMSPKAYTSQATLIVGQALSAANPDIGQITASQRLTDTYGRIVTTRPLLESVLADLKLEMDPEELRAQVSASVPQDSTLLTITVELGDPTTAAAVANGLATALIATSPALGGRETEVQEFVASNLRALQVQIQDSQEQLDRLVAIPEPTPGDEQLIQVLEGRLASLRASYTALLSYASDSSANELTVVEPAIAASAPSSPRTVLNVAVALILGTLLGIGLAFLAKYLDESVRTPEDVERASGAPVLGSIPRMALDSSRNPIYSLATVLYPRSSSAEAYRSMRTNLEFTGVDAPVKTILVTSALPREGKTIVACNLAVAYAQAGRNTILLDADLRRPDVHRLFGLENVSGLTDLLRLDSVLLNDLAHPTEVANLRIVTCGTIPPNPAELLASTRMAHILERIASSVEVVVIDSPPLNIVTDPAILARLVDGVVLVAEAGRTSSSALRRASESLVRVNARVLGVILNKEQAAGAIQSYGYYDGRDASATAAVGATAEATSAAQGVARQRRGGAR